MNENTYINEVILPSLIRAAEVFEKDGIRTEPSVGPSGDPGILLLFPEENIVISCDPLDEDGDRPLFYYQVSAFGFRSFGFPSVWLPEELEVFPFLPRLYRWLRFGMEDDVPADPDLVFFYTRTRLQGLQQELSEMGFDPELVNTAPAGSDQVIPGLRMNEGDEVMIFTYLWVVPELELCILQVACGEDRALLPEFGNLPDTEEYQLILPLIFTEGAEHQ